MIVEAAKELDVSLIEDFLQRKYNGKPGGDRWNRSVNNARRGQDCFNRTGTARSNMISCQFPSAARQSREHDLKKGPKTMGYLCFHVHLKTLSSHCDNG